MFNNMFVFNFVQLPFSHETDFIVFSYSGDVSEQSDTFTHFVTFSVILLGTVCQRGPFLKQHTLGCYCLLSFRSKGYLCSSMLSMTSGSTHSPIHFCM
jgi:hypothetical protein